MCFGHRHVCGIHPRVSNSSLVTTSLHVCTTTSAPIPWRRTLGLRPVGDAGEESSVDILAAVFWALPRSVLLGLCLVVMDTAHLVFMF